MRSLRIHGKGTDKYDNVRIGLNSRLGHPAGRCPGCEAGGIKKWGTGCREPSRQALYGTAQRYREDIYVYLLVSIPAGPSTPFCWKIEKCVTDSRRI